MDKQIRKALRAVTSVDSYKLSHLAMWPDNTSKVYSNFTPRTSRVPGVDRVVFFGLQAFLQDFLIDAFNDFFNADVDELCIAYEERVTAIVGPNDIGSEHIRALHQLGYVPLRFNALPEGTLVPLRVPMFTVENTHPDFFWLTNYIESVLSASIWLPCTSATTAWHFRQVLDEWAIKTSSIPSFVDFQGHDFSFRGMEGTQASAASGAGHLLSFVGSDTVLAHDYVADFYPGENGMVGVSVPASEHSVMSAGMVFREIEVEVEYEVEVTYDDAGFAVSERDL